MAIVDHINQVVTAHNPQEVTPKASTRQAAVAVILRETANGPELLFIKRAEKEGDPWSGHMAFPGGHRDPGDDSLEAAARRETLEEIDLDLSGAQYIGALDHQHAQPRGRVLDMLIAPHVYILHCAPGEKKSD